jgi:hypothetical protein
MTGNEKNITLYVSDVQETLARGIQNKDCLPFSLLREGTLTAKARASDEKNITLYVSDV